MIKQCEFCFKVPKLGYVCAGDKYRESVKDSLNDEKECYSESLIAFIERAEKEAIVMINTNLYQLKADGRTTISLIKK